MKKTLLLTSALVSSIALTSVANAEVKGSMKFGYGASDGASNDATAAGTQGFMRETQIDMSTKGELDNGISYKANAAFEAEATSIRLFRINCLADAWPPGISPQKPFDVG